MFNLYDNQIYDNKEKPIKTDKPQMKINKEGVYFYSKLISIILINAILATFLYLSFNVVSTIKKDDIRDMITSADKMQGSVKRLADYHAVLARKTSMAMETFGDSAKDAQKLINTTENLLGKEIPATLNALKDEAKNTSVISKSTVETINNLNTTILVVNKELPKLIDNINNQINTIGAKTSTTLDSTNLAILELKEVAGETRIQIKQNGDAAKELLVNGNALIAPEGDITKVIQELQGTVHGLNIITNDPNLGNLLNNANITMKNLGDITFNANLVSIEGARLSKYLTDKVIGTPPKNWADKYILRPAAIVLKTVGAFGQIFYLITYR
mgnify:CR=1 FL=1